MRMYIKEGEMPMLVEVLKALGYERVGLVPLDKYLPDYGDHKRMILDNGGELSSIGGWGESAMPGEVDLPTFITEAARLKLAESKTIKVALNEKYMAIISDKDVEVGCQTFSHERILEVARAVEKFAKEKPEYIRPQVGDIITKEFRFRNTFDELEVPVEDNLGRAIEKYDLARWLKPTK